MGLRYFGTDGIRGADQGDFFNREVIRSFALAFAAWLSDQRSGEELTIVIGRDTRGSGGWIEASLTEAWIAEGIHVDQLGVVPTPLVAYYAKMKQCIGVMISASHNPFTDNGLKFFSSTGYKLTPTDEQEIENKLNDTQVLDKTLTDAHGTVTRVPNVLETYMQFYKNILQDKTVYSGLRIVIDCANGAASAMAPQLFKALGMEVIILHDHPDGSNINEQCGSEHTADVAARVKEERASLGVAFDGDADRCIFVDEKGQVLKGDSVLGLLALSLSQEGSLAQNKLVVTTMSNQGLLATMQHHGIEVHTTDVGDRQVMRGMLEQGATLGGEDSGHIICGHMHTTGDGILSALVFIYHWKKSQQPLSQWVKAISIYPQTLQNVRVRSKPAIMEIPGLIEIIERTEAQLHNQGRVLVRYSGTEPICRVMLEGPDKEILQQFSAQICNVIKREIG